ncbi:MAG: ABC transporter permease [Candidatus Omnitrophota bacterium]
MLKNRLKKIYRYRRTLWDMAVLQLKAKYAGSRLGIWWAVVTPLILAACVNFIFSAAFKIDIPNYTFFVLSAMVPWIFFVSALDESLNSFITGGAVLKQTVFPRELVPISCILSNLLNFLIGLLFLLPLFVMLNFGVIKQLGGLILIITLHFFFVLGLGLLFASMNVFFRDLKHFLSIGFMAWFWITPVFYSLDMLSFPFRWIALLNPLTYYITAYRQILFAAKPLSWLTIGVSFFLAFGSFVFGYLFFLKKEAMLLKKI